MEKKQPMTVNEFMAKHEHLTNAHAHAIACWQADLWRRPYSTVKFHTTALGFTYAWFSRKNHYMSEAEEFPLPASWQQQKKED